MNIGEHSIFEKRRLALERSFFARRDRELLEKLREELERENLRKVLAEVTGVADQELLDIMVRYGARPETISAVFLIPIAEVAWADGKLEPAEREAIVRAYEQAGVAKNSVGRELLDSWLEEPPPQDLFEAWYDFIEVAKTQYPPEEIERLKNDVVARTIEVAEAAGSFLGLTSGISHAEREVIDRVRAAFELSAEGADS